MKRQGGFTLIELVVVIVILGILAVTAAPRFLNLQGDARHSALTGLEGAMKGAAGIVYGKAAIQGLESQASDSVSAAGKKVSTVYGYPAATEAGIVAALTGFEANGDWVIVKDSAKDKTILLTFSEYKDQNQKDLDDNNRKCYIQYTEAADKNSEPTITLSADACK